MKANDCENCPFFWEEKGLEDCDCGCELDLDYGKHRFLYFICYMPTWSLGIIYKIACIVSDARWWILTRGKEDGKTDI